MFIITQSGRKFEFLNPKPESICIDDITHALSLIPRFGGHIDPFYSVAQHSVLVASLHPTLSALMHDAHEAYVGDVPTPLKNMCPDYQRIEVIARDAVAARYGLTADDPAIHEADHLALLAEARDFMAAPPWVQPELHKVTHIKRIQTWDYTTARRNFICAFIILASNINACQNGRVGGGQPS